MIKTYFTVGIVLVFVFFNYSIHLWSFKSHAKIEITKPKHTVKVFCQICLWNKTHNKHHWLKREADPEWKGEVKNRLIASIAVIDSDTTQGIHSHISSLIDYSTAIA